MKFKAPKKKPKKVRVSFYSEKGKRIEFVAVKRVPKRVQVKFYKKNGQSES